MITALLKKFLGCWGEDERARLVRLERLARGEPFIRLVAAERARVEAEKRVGRQRAENNRLEKANLRYREALKKIADAGFYDRDAGEFAALARMALYGKV